MLLKNGKEVYVMVLKITPKQRIKINALVRKICCNCYKGNCLLLGDGKGTKCVQLIRNLSRENRHPKRERIRGLNKCV